MKYDYPVACEYLCRVREAERHVAWLRQRVENMRMLLTDTSVHLTDMPHSDSPDMQKHETLHAEIDELEREIAEAEKAKEDIRIEVGRTVCRLSDPIIQRVLILHYLDGKRWKDVAVAIKYSVPRTHQFRDMGMKELDQLLRTT